MKTFEATWTDGRGLAFFGRGWEPDGAPKAAVALVHGHGEHTGRWPHVGQALAQAGYAFMGFDLRGHGRSGGPRGYARSGEEYLDDIDLFLRQVRARYAGLPVFLYGHSLGGALVLNYALQRKPQLAGVIATSPALHNEPEQHAEKVFMAKLLGRLAPGLTLSTGLPTAMLSHDPHVVQAYNADPLVHDKMSVGAGRGVLLANRWTLEHAAEFSMPLLLVHGDQDQIAFPSSSQEIAAALGDRATLVMWPGMYHETHNEREKDKVLQATIGWLDAHLPK